MRLKLGLLALALTAALVGIPYYLDSRIPRATAVVQIHLPFLNPQVIEEGKPGTLITGPGSSRENYFETIVDPETLRMALKQLHSDTGENTIITQSDIETLRSKIKAEPRRGTDFIEITGKDQSCEDAVRFANAVAKAFAARVNNAERERAERALTALNDEVLAQSDLVQEHHKELTVLIQQYGVGDSSPFEMTEAEFVESAKKRLPRFKQMRDQTAVQLKKLEVPTDDAIIVYAAGLDLPENQVSYYYLKYQEALVERASLFDQGLKSNGPEIGAIDKRAKNLMKDAHEEVISLKENLSTKYDLVVRQIERFQRILDEEKEDTYGLQLRSTQYNETKKAYEQSRSELGETGLRQKEAQILFENIRDTVTIHQLAQ